MGKLGTINDSSSPCTAPQNLSFTTTRSAKVYINKCAKINIKADGTTLVNERPFFPFGFYHVSWEATAEERIQDLQEIGLAGFNTIHASATNMNDCGEFLDRAEKLGVYIVTEQNVGLLNFINAFKHKPAVLGWNIGDDVDDGKLVPQGVLKVHQQAKLAAPHHITYISGFTDNIK